MPVNDSPNVDDAISQAQEQIRNSSCLHRLTLLEECLKKWTRHDDSSTDGSSSDDFSSDDDEGPALALPGVGVEVDDGDAETSPRHDTESALPSVSDDEAGPPRKRRRQDEFPGERQGDTENSDTLEPSPGPSGFSGNHSSDEDDVDDTYPVRGAPLPDWLDVHGEAFEDPLQDPDLSFLDDV
ncbi:hypothetical protein MTO96_043172 [Rhipicephalus appendiculatus]